MELKTLGNLKVVRAKDSESFSDRRTGFVAVTKYGSEYFAETQNRAIQRAIEVNGADVI